MTDREPDFCDFANSGCVTSARACKGLETHVLDAPNVVETDSGESVLADKALSLVGVRCERFPDRIRPSNPNSFTQDRKEG